MKLKALNALLVGLFPLWCSIAATVSDVAARQRYPWNGMVDIDYTITGEDTENTAIDVKVTDTDTGKIYTPTNFLEVPPTVAGRHRITWSTEADGLNLIASNVTVTVSLLKYDAAAITNDLYYVIDLSGGPNAMRWPVSCLSAVPKGGWTDEYKTTKLVLRRIEKGSISGINSGTYGVSSITIDKPYYIGIFEVTSAQYAQMNGRTEEDARPTTRTYDTLRGSSAGALYPDSTAVDATSVIGILRAKTGLTTLDLPTEAQWEYACRAGTTSDYNNGGSTEADLATLGRYRGNQEDGRGGFSGSKPTTVGSYAPNRWGLYDMHGNVWEWCLDWDHVGIERVMCGGSFSESAGYCRSGSRQGEHPSSNTYLWDGYGGFRLCCSAGL